MRPWLKSEMNLFKLSSTGEFDFLTSTAIKSISWESLDRAEVQLIGALPMALPLLGIRTGDCLEILKKPAGQRDEYLENQVVIRIRNVEQRRWSVTDPVILWPSQDETVELELSVVGRLEWVMQE